MHTLGLLKRFFTSSKCSQHSFQHSTHANTFERIQLAVSQKLYRMSVELEKSWFFEVRSNKLTKSAEFYGIRCHVFLWHRYGMKNN